MVIIDPMHNIFLGSAKCVMKRLWIEKGILNQAQLLEMQQFVDEVHVPPDIGRIPRKLETGFSGFTAAQFKNWVNLYSIPALFGMVESCHLECWRHLVLASRLLCKHTINKTDIIVADLLLLQFFKKIEQLFGRTAITPNMHLHGHLKTVVEDFGPLHGFWLFAYERYNGILGNYPNNNKSIKPQLMKKFLHDNALLSLEQPNEFSQEFLMHFKKFERGVGLDFDYNSNFTDDNSNIALPPRYKTGVLSNSDISSLLPVLSQKLGVPPSSISINSCFKQYSSIQISGKMFNSCMKKSSHNFISLALWDVDIFGRPRSQLPRPDIQDANEHIRPIEISYFATISYIYNIDGVEKDGSETFAIASWFLPHPNRYILGKPADIWCKSVFEISGPHSFVPYFLIKSRCAYVFKKLDELQDESVLIVVGIVE